MIKNSTHSDTRVTHALLWLTGVVFSLLVLLFPLGYYFLAEQYMAGSLEAEAEINARNITQIISSNPDMWQFEQVRIQEHLSRRPKKGYAETRRVLNLNKEVIAESADEVAPPVMARSVELFDSGTVVGRIEISRSLRPRVVTAGCIGHGMHPQGAAGFMTK